MFVWPVFFSPFLKKKEGKGETSLKCAQHLSCAAGLFPSLFLSRIVRIPYSSRSFLFSSPGIKRRTTQNRLEPHGIKKIELDTCADFSYLLTSSAAQDVYKNYKPFLLFL
jgi:hypothetical protein